MHWLEVCWPRERKAHVTLEEGITSATQGTNALTDSRLIHVNWNRSAFREVDPQACCSSKALQNDLEVLDIPELTTNDDQGVVRVLKNWAGAVINQRMCDQIKITLDHLLKYIRHKQEQKRRQRITLPQTALYCNPWSWAAIDKNG